MTIFKLLESEINEVREKYSDYLEGLNDEGEKSGLFMLYSLDNIFRNLDLDTIEDGIIDSSYRRESHDYGIDAIYITTNKEVMENPEELENFNEDAKFDIHILQFKNKTGIEQADLLKLKEGIKTVFIDNEFGQENNDYIYKRLKIINEIKDKIYTKFSTSFINIKFYLVFKGLLSNVLENSLLKKQLNEIKKILTNSGYVNNQYEVIDAQKILDLSNKGDETEDIIQYQRMFKYITDIENNKQLNGYISIISGSEIAKLVKLRQSSIFEANIRDYYKVNDINEKIFKTSVDKKEANYFWSFNNGITIVCKKVEELPSDRFRLYNTQIVNGCQTSNSLYRALKNKEKYEEIISKTKEELNEEELKLLESLKNNILNDTSSVLVKIIETSNPDLIYRITETTNSQIPIETFSLESPKDIHKNIELYLLKHGIYYERRINYYKNQGKKYIVSIRKLFQLYLSQIMIKPSQARTNPKTLFISLHEKVFPPTPQNQIDYTLYLMPIKIDLKISKIVRNIQRNKIITDNYKLQLLSYGKFHLGCFLLKSIIGKKYNEKIIVSEANEINKILDDNETLIKLFEEALNSFEKIVKNIAGQKKESIALTLRKNELDEKIAKFVRLN